MKQSSDNRIQEPVGRVMATIGRLYLAEVHKNLSQLGLQRSYYPLLLIEKENGKLTQQELAMKLSCDKVRVTRIVDYLSSKGYVTRAQNNTDRRKHNLEITDKARNSIPQIKRAISRATEKAFGDLSESRIEELYSILKTIERNLLKNN